MRNLAYEAALANLYEKYNNETFAKHLGFTPRDWQEDFKSIILNATHQSFATYSNWNASSIENERFFYIDFLKYVREAVADLFEKDETDIMDMKDILNHEVFAELVHYEILEDILNQHYDNKNIELHFFAKELGDEVGTIQILATQHLNNTQVDLDNKTNIHRDKPECCDLFYGNDDDSFKTFDVLKNVVIFLNEVEKNAGTNEQYDITNSPSYEDEVVRMCIDDDKMYSEIKGNPDDWFFVSNRTNTDKVMSLPGDNNVHFDGRIGKIVDSDELLKKYPLVTSEELSDVYESVVNQHCNRLWDKDAENNLFDKTDKFLIDNKLDFDFTVMCYKGKFFETIPLYKESQNIDSDYSSYGSVVKFAKPYSQKEAVNKIHNFLEQEKSNFEKQIAEEIEANLDFIQQEKTTSHKFKGQKQ